MQDWQSCGQCGSVLQIEVFPAIFRETTPSRPAEALMLDGESSCFYHPNKKAVLPCQGCGRFMCALCDCELHGQHFCPACLEVGRAKGKIKNLENHRVLYDTIALALAVLPVVTLFFWFATIVTGPMALFIAVRYWNAPLSLVRRTKIRYVIAMAFGAVEMTGWGILFYLFFARLNV
jgi:hypothetical protein